MATAAQADAAVLLWLNGWVGRFPWLDTAARLVVSDYLVPVLLSLLLFGMWFAGREPTLRERHQRAVLRAIIGMGFASLVVLIANHYVFRPRPFTQYELQLLFYMPTDSSFPSNPAVVGFAMATGIWTGNRSLGLVAFLGAGLWGLSRVYAGVSYPSDVVAGALLGMAATLLVSGALATIEPLPTLVLRLAQRFHLA
ncbi:MAG: phosphatase PAP2 family protein [Chloroflexi bacterium]|nr:phosphatase PAP2 family protein [Chloroflexota bacterium]